MIEQRLVLQRVRAACEFIEACEGDMRGCARLLHQGAHVGHKGIDVIVVARLDVSTLHHIVGNGEVTGGHGHGGLRSLRWGEDAAGWGSVVELNRCARRRRTTYATEQPQSTTVPAAGGNCDPSYPDVCIPPALPNLDCSDIPHTCFRVVPPDSHRLDGNKDGVGCEG